MSNKEKLRDEISYWSYHQELDKFNFNHAMTLILATLAIVVGLMPIIENINNLYVKVPIQVGILIFILIVFGINWKRAQNSNNHWVARDEMIEERYCKIHNMKKGEFKKSLSEECVEIRKKLDNATKIFNHKIWLIFLTVIFIVNLGLTIWIMIKTQ